MGIEELREEITNRGDEALVMAEEIGPPALPLLIELLQSKNNDIRLAAVGCVSVITDDEVTKILISTLSDPDQRVRLRALQSLQGKTLTLAHQSSLVLHLDHPDDEIRAEVPLFLGRLDHAPSSDPLRKRLKEETTEAVRHSLVLALARLGDPEMTKKVLDQLNVPETQNRMYTLQDLEYIGDRSLALHLGPTLEDRSEAYNVGHPQRPRYARICDATVNLIARWYDQPFGFETHHIKNYTDEEIDEARKFIESLGE